MNIRIILLYDAEIVQLGVAYSTDTRQVEHVSDSRLNELFRHARPIFH